MKLVVHSGEVGVQTFDASQTVLWNLDIAGYRVEHEYYFDTTDITPKKFIRYFLELSTDAELVEFKLRYL